MVVMSSHRSAAVLSLLVAAVVALAGCGANADSPRAAGGGDGRLRLVASFYPLQWTAEQVAGAGAAVASLTKPGAEPHDLELTPQDVATVSDADLVVYLKGFQPAVDDAVGQEAGDRGFDVSKAADLNLTYTPIEEGQQHTDEAGATDPHFWLDPLRLAAVGDALAGRLGTLDPTHATRYEANAVALRAKLEALDRDYQAGLADCANPDLVTSHNAFGYLAQRYGLTQVGITGLTPDDEPKPGDLAGIASFVEKNGVRTIYYETLVSPAIAKTVAAETGARTEVLDPIEGLTRDSQGADYLQVMRANLVNIRKGQPCT
jgi:zinc transport system substrate-binding protein